MSETSYAFPMGGLPGQSENPEGRAVFTESYAMIPADTMRDIVASLLPGWERTRAWILARPMTGFAETFAQYAVEVAPGGGSATPEPDAQAQAILFVARGTARLSIDGAEHVLTAGGFAHIPAGAIWSLDNPGTEPLCIHWLRKRWEPAPGLVPPPLVISSDHEVAPTPMPDTDGVWATTRFVDTADPRFDCHVNIVTFQPGGRIPFAETHVMEHGLYVLQGTARYLLNRDWVEVGPGDFMWLRAFCPQACIATGDEPFRYLLYKDVNRHPKLGLGE